MRIIIIGGFLGSGKTMTIKNIVQQFSQIDLAKIALIINDFGEIGIDASVVRPSGIEPFELVSGCICCQLGMDLIKTISTIYTDYNPGTVILEPSGVANPASLKTLILGQKEFPVSNIKSVYLVDPIRLNTLLEIPIVEEGISSADVLVITKTDLVDQSIISKVKEKVKTFIGTTEIFEIDNLKRTGLEQLFEVLI